MENVKDIAYDLIMIDHGQKCLVKRSYDYGKLLILKENLERNGIDSLSIEEISMTPIK